MFSNVDNVVEVSARQAAQCHKIKFHFDKSATNMSKVRICPSLRCKFFGHKTKIYTKNFVLTNFNLIAKNNLNI